MSGTSPTRCSWRPSAWRTSCPVKLTWMPPGTTRSVTSPSAPAVCEPTNFVSFAASKKSAVCSAWLHRVLVDEHDRLTAVERLGALREGLPEEARGAVLPARQGDEGLEELRCNPGVPHVEVRSDPRHRAVRIAAHVEHDGRRLPDRREHGVDVSDLESVEIDIADVAVHEAVHIGPGARDMPLLHAGERQLVIRSVAAPDADGQPREPGARSQDQRRRRPLPVLLRDGARGCPEDPLIYLIQDEECGPAARADAPSSPRSRGKTGLLFERSEGWCIVSLRGKCRGRPPRAALYERRSSACGSLLVDFQQMHRDGELRLSARSRAIIARTLAMEIPPPRRRPRATKKAR